MGSSAAIEDQGIKAGLLMEAAHAQQNLAETALQKLAAHVAGLDEVVRGEIHRALTEELKVLGRDTEEAARALQRLKRTASWRLALWGLGMSALCLILPLSAVWWILPSQAELESLRGQRDQLSAGIQALERRGGRIELRTCGSDRLCVRVDRKAPAFGAAGDYLVIKGY